MRSRNRFASCSFLVRGLVPVATVLAIACGGGGTPSGFDANGNPKPTGTTVDSGGGGGETSGGGPSDFGDSGTTTSPPIDSDAGCATGSGVASRQPVHMMLVVDRSGSMVGVKWAAQSAAVTAVVNQLGAEADPTLALGFDFFADGFTDTAIEEAMGPVTAAKAQRVASLVAGATPTGGTPTYDALTLAYNALNAYKPTGVLANGAKVVVLMSDGVPSPSLSHLGNPKPETQLIYDLVADAAKTGTRTYALGVGVFPGSSDYDPKFMGNVAVQGNTRLTPTCNPNETTSVTNVCHFQVTPPASGSPTPAETAALTKSFTDALTAIRGQVGSCDFALSFAAGASVDFNKVNVVFTDASGHVRVVFSKDPQNGWSYDNEQNPKSVHLSGAACDQVKTTPGKVTVVLGCDPGGIK